MSLPAIEIECVGPPKIHYVEILTPKAMVLGDGAFGVSALIYGISAPIKAAEESPLAPSAPCGYCDRMTVQEEVGLHQTLTLPWL